MTITETSKPMRERPLSSKAQALTAELVEGDEVQAIMQRVEKTQSDLLYSTRPTQAFPAV
ncbi:MAG: hypothetical protein DMG70_22685 [Acidobacteria bacterium]|nr:MAG: hypothetical protein DMG70_22685 [Acidobacteriota bacterium]PYY07236.1 MAG: hypothetical protein DMG69_20285 [Acidobacteriota bacterium]